MLGCAMWYDCAKWYDCGCAFDRSVILALQGNVACCLFCTAAACDCRYDVLQEMLEVLRDHQNNQHMSRLEWIVIILIALAVSDCGD